MEQPTWRVYETTTEVERQELSVVDAPYAIQTVFREFMIGSATGKPDEMGLV